MEIFKFILFLFFNPKKLKIICADNEAVDEVRNSILKAFRWSLQMIISVLVTWYLFQRFDIVIDKTIIGILKITGPLLVLWSVQGKPGFSIQTYGGESIPEKISATWSRWLYMIGVFTALLAQVL